MIDVDHYHLKSGHTKSCGCAKLEMLTARLSTHGLSKRAEYKNWLDMRGRCLNSNHKRFEHYGGRGITICERWSNFANFYEDMGPRPQGKPSVERIDVNGNYEPSNCCWASIPEQQRNRRDTIKRTFNGRTLSISEWSRLLQIPQQTLHRWITKDGLTIEQSIARFSSRAR